MRVVATIPNALADTTIAMKVTEAIQISNVSELLKV